MAASGTGGLRPAVLQRLRRVDHALAQQLDAQVRRIDTLLSRPEVTIVFGGHFSCGKSTLLNMLIGRPLLPSGEFPETGVPCRLTAGSADRVSALTENGESDLPVSTEAIAREVSLIDDEGARRGRVAAVREVRVTLAGGVIPPRVQWVDSPGINDTAEMTERAGGVARQGDLLVWVVDSRRPLSLVEQDFLAGHLAVHGPRSVVYVVNVFLPEDTTACWERFLAERTPYHRARLADATGQDASDVVFVSARAGAANPDGFGAPQLRRLLASLADHEHPLIAGTRRRRAAALIRELAGQADARVDKERTRLKAAAAEAERVRQERAARQRAFNSAIQQAVAQTFRRHRTSFDQCGQEVAEEISAGPLQRDGTYSESLSSRLTDAAGRLCSDVLAEAGRLAREHNRGTVPPEVARQVTRRLAARQVTVTVPDTPLRRKGGVAALVGGAIGTALLPGVGTALGAVIGGVLGAGSGINEAVNADIAGARAAALKAASEEGERLLAKRKEIADLIAQGCPDTVKPPIEPSDEAARTLETVREGLLAWAEECERGVP